ncbi:MAG: heavy metal translocating P-type ATPase [Anaerolineae bacterium]
MPPESKEHTFHLAGLDCATCAQTIERGVSKLDQVELCSVNFGTEILRVKGSAHPDAIVARIRELGYDVIQSSTPSERPPIIHPPTAAFLPFMWQRQDTRLALLGALLVLPGLLFNELLPTLGMASIWLDASSVAAMVVAGYPIAHSAWRAIQINHEININVLMSIAAIGAAVIGAYSEAGLVMVLFSFGEALEGFAGARARASIRSLMAVAPNEAIVLRPSPDGPQEQLVLVNDLRVGEIVVVKPGGRIPMDGRILSGHSAVNQAPITGESRLIEKAPDDMVFAGSINGRGALEIEVTHLAADNTISRLIRMVAEAQERRAPAQRFVDQFAKVYTPAVVVLAILVAAVPPLLFNQPFWETAGNSGWLYRALALLVVACPCALVISTPVSIISAISNGARSGVLFKGGATLETLSRVRAMAFDKTGTLTEGRPTVVRYRSVNCVSEEGCNCCDDLLALSSAVEQRSAHPLAQAVLNESMQRGLRGRYPAASDVQTITGNGVTGEVNGRRVTIGSHAYFDTNVPHDDHCALVGQADAEGYTTMLVRDGAAYAGYIVVADTLRSSSKTAVAELKQLGISPLVMLTGDNETTANKIGQEVGVTAVQANCLPQDKVTAISQLRDQYGVVAMVGDGINDAPALATANVGIAIGNTAQAMETADIVLMGDDLRRLPFALRLSRATMRTIRVNIGLSIGVKLAFLALVLAGLGSMWLAVFADVGVSLLVTVNGMRLRGKRHSQDSRASL